MKKLANLYDQLSSEERFTAFYAAAGRMDTAEMDLLNDTCPRKTYTMDDWDYTRMKMRFFHTFLCIQMRLEKITGALAALAVVTAYIDDGSDEQSLKVAKNLVTHHRALLEAWGLFCERIGLGRDTGTALLNQLKDEFREFLLEIMNDEAIGEIPSPAPEAIEREVSTLLETWG